MTLTPQDFVSKWKWVTAREKQICYVLAHKKLGTDFFAICGWPSGLSDEEILEKLLALNLERAG